MSDETVKLGSASSTVFFEVEDYTTFKKGTEDSFDDLVLGNFPISVDGQKVGNIDIVYLKDDYIHLTYFQRIKRFIFHSEFHVYAGVCLKVFYLFNLPIFQFQKEVQTNE